MKKRYSIRANKWVDEWSKSESKNIEIETKTVRTQHSVFCSSSFCCCWLVVQFAKLNLTRNLFTPSGFFLSTVRQLHQEHSTFTFIFSEICIGMRWNNKMTAKKTRKKEREWERNNPRHYKELNIITNTNRKKNVFRFDKRFIMHISSTKHLKLNAW